MLRELTFEEPTNGDPGTLAAVLQIVRQEREMVIGGPEFYTYRVAVLFEAPLPARFEIAHRDADGNTQFEVADVFLHDPNAYQEKRFGR